MAIVSYRVDRANGLAGNLENVETNFSIENNNPLAARRAAIGFAKNLFAEVRENADLVDFNPERPIQRGDEAGMDITVSVIYDDGEESIIYGSFINHMLENWADEAENYLGNDYDTDGPLMHLDATVCHLGFIEVLRDDFEEYGLDNLNQYFPED